MVVFFFVSDPDQSSVLSCYEQLSSLLELVVTFETQDHSSGTNSGNGPAADVQEVRVNTSEECAFSAQSPHPEVIQK